jgi:drug/metabolite transporter (DMT)-like permease
MASFPVWQLLLGTGVLFGLGLPLSQLGAREGVDVLAFAVWPTAIAAVGLVALGWLRHGRPSLTPGLLRFGLLAGTFGHAVPAAAGYWLARETGAGFAALAYTMPPVLTLALTLLLRLEAPVARRIGAVALGLAGALLLVAGRGADFEVQPIALALLLLIPVSIAGANVYRALQLPKNVPAEWLAALMLSSSAGVLAASSALHGSLAVPLRTGALIWPAVQAVAMLAAYLMFFALQRRAEPVTTSFVGYVSMITGTAAGAVAFGERLPAIVWPALALIAGSMWLLKRPASDVAAASIADDMAPAAACANDHCSVYSQDSLPFDCSPRGLLPCA